MTRQLEYSGVRDRLFQLRDATRRNPPLAEIVRPLLRVIRKEHPPIIPNRDPQKRSAGFGLLTIVIPPDRKEWPLRLSARRARTECEANEHERQEPFHVHRSR